MLARKPAAMSVEAFLAWEVSQEEKFELVDGAPVPRALRLMAGGTVTHGLIAANLLYTIRTRLPKGPCAPLTSDVRVRTTAGVRYPDAMIDCGPRRPGQLTAEDPRALFEVISPSNSFAAQQRLLDEYQGVETLNAIAFIAQTTAFAYVWLREGALWRRADAEGLAAHIALPEWGIALPMAEIYEGAALDDAGPTA